MRRDRAYLKHILEAISNIEKFVEGLTKEQFFENVKKQYAVLRGLEIIGEATKNLSKDLKAKYREIPWRDRWYEGQVDPPILWCEPRTGLGNHQRQTPRI